MGGTIMRVKKRVWVFPISIAFLLSLVFFLVTSTSFADTNEVEVTLKYDIGRLARTNVWGISTALETPILSSPMKTLRLEIFKSNDLTPENLVASRDKENNSPLNQLQSDFKFTVAPGVFYFKLSYKTPSVSGDIFYDSASGPFTVSADSTGVYYLSHFQIAGQTVKDAVPGYEIEAFDYQGNKMSPSSAVLVDPSDESKGYKSHTYTAVAVTSADKKGYTYKITPMDESFGHEEKEIFWPKLQDSVCNSTTPTVVPRISFNPRNAVNVTFFVTSGAGIKANRKGTMHFVPFSDYPLTKGETVDGYDTFTGNLPFIFQYETGGRGSKYLKHVQSVELSRGIATINITVDVEKLDRSNRDPYDTGDSRLFFDDVYFNVNDAQQLALKQDETFKLMPIRVWQAQVGVIGNVFIEPDYHIEVLGDKNALELKWEGAPGCEYASVKAVTPGVAILSVTYDPLVWYKQPQDYLSGANPNYLAHDYKVTQSDKDYYFNAIDPRNTGIVVVHVPNSAELTASEDVKLNTGIKQLEYDTNYFDTEKTDHAIYTFTPTAEKGEISVRVHRPIHIKEGGTQLAWGYGWEPAAENEDGSYTVKLYEGRSVVEVSVGDVKRYHVLNARSVKVNIVNKSDPGKLFNVGDTAQISFDGLKLQLAKIAGIYNPGYPEGNYVLYQRFDNGEFLRSRGAQYEIAFPEANMIEMEMTSVGEQRLVNGVMKTNHLGRSLGSHRFTPETGIPPMDDNDAPIYVREYNTLPDITIRVGEPPVIVASLPAAVLGKEYSQKLTASGATPITWTLTGDLPDGLTFDTATGAISGTPTKIDRGSVRRRRGNGNYRS
jgi:hypothetical protein